MVEQCRRIFDALAEAISQRGYEHASVLHVIEPAGVSRRTFYALFANKGEAFITGPHLSYCEDLFLGACALVASRLRAWPASSLPALIPELTQFVLTPYVERPRTAAAMEV